MCEAYTPQRLTYKTGGPPNETMRMDENIVSNELDGLKFINLQEKVREVPEGEFHNGTGAVVQALAEKI